MLYERNTCKELFCGLLLLRFHSAQRPLYWLAAIEDLGELLRNFQKIRSRILYINKYSALESSNLFRNLWLFIYPWSWENMIKLGHLSAICRWTLWNDPQDPFRHLRAGKINETFITSGRADLGEISTTQLFTKLQINVLINARGVLKNIFIKITCNWIRSDGTTLKSLQGPRRSTDEGHELCKVVSA